VSGGYVKKVVGAEGKAGGGLAAGGGVPPVTSATFNVAPLA
jgi:hypothetical protein